MSRTVDERIVDMQFNNKQFQTGVSDSVTSLEKLKKGLDLKDANTSLSGLSATAGKFSLAGIASGVDTIASKFSALGMIGVTALVNITNSAINTGKQLLKSLTVDPIQQGFGSYETKVNAIKTVMAGTGETIDEVTKSLDELNTYSDKTVYSFQDMTENISKFTNAGLSSKEAATAIKGISNVAAISGANAGEAARAMYNFGQSLSQGSVRLMDWKSIENANMATVGFKTQLLDAAVAAGTLTKSADGMYKTLKNTPVSATKGFNESLEQQWMTTKVLSSTLADYASETTEIGKKANSAAQDVLTFTQMLATMKDSVKTGWTKSWSAIIGDNVQATALFTSINNAFGSIVGPSTEARNAMLQFWSANGGREAIINAISNAFAFLQKVLKPIKEGLQYFFPPTTGKDLLNISLAIEAFTEKLKIGGKGMDKLRRTFMGVSAVFDIGRQFVVALAKGFKILFDRIMPTSDGILSLTAGIGDWLVGLNQYIWDTDLFNTGVEKMVIAIDWATGKFEQASVFIKKVVNTIKIAMYQFAQSFAALDLSGLDMFATRVQTRFEPLTKLGDIVGWAFGAMLKVFTKVAPVVLAIARLIGKVFGTLSEKVTNAFNNADFNAVFDLANGGMLMAIFLGLSKFIKSLTGMTDGIGGSLKGIAGFVKGITGILDGVKGSLAAYQAQLKAGTLVKIAIAVGILAASLLVLSLIDSEKLTVAMVAITTLFAELTASMAIFQKSMGVTGSKGMMGAGAAMIALSVAVLILAVAMKKLASIDQEGISKGLLAVGVLTAGLIATAKLLSSNTGTMMKGGLGFIFFAGAILILSSAVKKLGELNKDELTKGLIGVGVVITELALFMKVTNLDGMGASKGVGLLLLGVAINILATAVAKFGALDVKTLIKGLAAMGGVLTELALFIKITGGAKKVVATGVALVLIGAAMLIFASAIEKMGNLSLEQIGKGLLTMGGALTLITAAVNLMPPNMLLSAIALVAISAALLILASAIKSMGGMSWEEIAKGLTVLAGSLAIIVIAMQLMTTALLGAAALLVISAALTILAGVMKTLGGMALKEIGIALLALIGVFVVLGVAGLVLAPLVPVLLALGIAIALLGIAVLAIGAGLLLFSAGLTALSIAGTAGAAALVLVVTSLLSLIPFAMQMLGEGIISFAKVIGEAGPVLLTAMTTVILALVLAIDATAPKAIECLMRLLVNLLAALAESVPKMVVSGMKLITGILRGIADHIEEVVVAGVDIVLGFIRGITKKLPDIIDAAFKLIISFINGLADAIRNNSVAIHAACGNLIDAIIGELKSLFYKFVEVGSNIIQGMIDGVKNMALTAKNAVVQVATDVLNGIKNFLGIHSASTEFLSIGKNMIQGLIDGIKDMAKTAANAALKVAQDVMAGIKNFLGIRSPSTALADVGMNMDKGLAGGLKKYSSLVGDQATDVGIIAVNSLSNAVSRIGDAITGDMDMTPTIRPVLDLTNIATGSKQIDSLLSNKGISVDGTSSQATAASQVANAGMNAQLSRDMKNALAELKDAFKGAFDTLTTVPPQVNFNGTYSFAGQEDINYFMNQAALLVQRRKS